jgi:acetyltransferase-like isoleucine patch superfamily enzyme
VYRLLNPATARALIFSWFVRLRLRSCGRKLRLRVTTTILGHRRISIGNNFSSMGMLYLYANEGGDIRIGDDCAVNTNVQIGAAGGKIIIGNYVMIAPNVVLRAANHGMQRGAIPMRHQPSVPGEIVIEDDVWIGSNAVITADVRIARGTVVGAGAVVTSSTDPYTIVGGVPATKIGERPEGAVARERASASRMHAHQG